MSLGDRARASEHLSQQQKLIMCLISETLDNPSVEELVYCLTGEPYQLTPIEITDALNSLAKRGLIELSHFTKDDNRPHILHVHITFAMDWVFKL